MNRTFTIREYALILAVLTAAHRSAAISYGDALMLCNTADKMAKAGIAS